MIHQAESRLQPAVAYYSPPPLEVVSYGPKFEAIEQDSFQPAGEDDSDNSFPLLDSYLDSFVLPRPREPLIADGRSESRRPGVSRRLAWNEKPIPMVVTNPHYRFDSPGGIRLRE